MVNNYFLFFFFKSLLSSLNKLEDKKFRQVCYEHQIRVSALKKIFVEAHIEGLLSRAPLSLEKNRNSFLVYFLPVMCVRLFAQSCPTLCDPLDCSLPSSSVHEVLQASIVEWIAISFSRGSSQLGIKRRSPALQVDSL